MCNQSKHLKYHSHVRNVNLVVEVWFKVWISIQFGNNFTWITCQQNPCDTKTLQEDAILHEMTYKQKWLVGIEVKFGGGREQMALLLTTFPSAPKASCQDPSRKHLNAWEKKRKTRPVICIDALLRHKVASAMQVTTTEIKLAAKPKSLFKNAHTSLKDKLTNITNVQKPHRVEPSAAGIRWLIT